MSSKANVGVEVHLEAIALRTGVKLYETLSCGEILFDRGVDTRDRAMPMKIDSYDS